MKQLPPPCRAKWHERALDHRRNGSGRARAGRWVLPADVNGISIDSRTVGKGDAFFAIKGDNRDGHEFVEGALKAGAALAVVSSAQRARFPDAPLLDRA